LPSLPLRARHLPGWQSGRVVAALTPGTTLRFRLAERLGFDTIHELSLVWRFWVGLQCFSPHV